MCTYEKELRKNVCGNKNIFQKQKMNPFCFTFSDTTRHYTKLETFTLIISIHVRTTLHYTTYPGFTQLTLLVIKNGVAELHLAVVDN